jgi:hypothetical protein
MEMIETEERFIYIEGRTSSPESKVVSLLTLAVFAIGGFMLYSHSKQLHIERVLRLWLRVADDKGLEFDDEYMEEELRRLSLWDLMTLAEYHELIVWEKKSRENDSQSMRKRRMIEKKLERLESMKYAYNHKGIEDRIDLTAINYIIED